jgi:hypothetical protein
VPYLEDGAVGGQRILPPGRPQHATSSKPTSGSLAATFCDASSWAPASRTRNGDGAQLDVWIARPSRSALWNNAERSVALVTPPAPAGRGRGPAPHRTSVQHRDRLTSWLVSFAMNTMREPNLESIHRLAPAA